MTEKEIEGMQSDIMVLVERVIELEMKVEVLWGMYLKRFEKKGL